MGFLDKAKGMFDKAGGTEKAKELVDKAGGVDKIEEVSASALGQADTRLDGKIPDQAYDLVDKIDGKDDLPPKPKA
jgi:hypothetical protein